MKRSRCDRVLTCTYPEKKTCQALLAEIDWLSEEITNTQERAKQKVQEIGQQIHQLMNERSK
jgi:ABC-type hemin transport system substrate-binding protein